MPRVSLAIARGGLQLTQAAADVATLVVSLNRLLMVLDIPIAVSSPTDLTPSLLLAVLESILEARLPIPSALRSANTPQSRVEAVKIFLGVLANDVLNVDLSQVDPRRLANGEWDEVIYIARILVHVARRSRLMGDDEAIVDVDPDLTSVTQVLEDDMLAERLPLQMTPSISSRPSGSPTRVDEQSSWRTALVHHGSERSTGTRRLSVTETNSNDLPRHNSTSSSFMTHRPPVSPQRPFRPRADMADASWEQSADLCGCAGPVTGPRAPLSITRQPPLSDSSASTKTSRKDGWLRVVEDPSEVTYLSDPSIRFLPRLRSRDQVDDSVCPDELTRCCSNQ